jgi:hypothetical protein
MLTLYNPIVRGVQARVRGYVAGLLQDWGRARTHQHQPQAGAQHQLFHLHTIIEKHTLKVLFLDFLPSTVIFKSNSDPE